MPDRIDYRYWLRTARDSHRKARKLLADPDIRWGVARARAAARDYLRSAILRSQHSIPASHVESNGLLELAENLSKENPAFQLSKKIPAPDGRIFTVAEALALFEQLEPVTDAETVLALLSRIARELDLASEVAATLSAKSSTTHHRLRVYPVAPSRKGTSVSLDPNLLLKALNDDLKACHKAARFNSSVEDQQRSDLEFSNLLTHLRWAKSAGYDQSQLDRIVRSLEANHLLRGYQRWRKRCQAD